MKERIIQGLVGILLWIWQLPQHLTALLCIRITGAEKTSFNGVPVWVYGKAGFLSGVSLGNYILLPQVKYTDTSVKHEMGHSIQSRFFGPLYLLLIGLPSSVFNNLWDRVFHKKWEAAERVKWYYSRYPEKWADRLGGVIRDYK